MRKTIKDIVLLMECGLDGELAIAAKTEMMALENLPYAGGALGCLWRSGVYQSVYNGW